MYQIIENHTVLLQTSRSICKIVFNKEFTSLCEELSSIYSVYMLENPEQEAFHDALYCFLTQQEKTRRALS